jgi:hypothetical protein
LNNIVNCEIASIKELCITIDPAISLGTFDRIEKKPFTDFFPVLSLEYLKQFGVQIGVSSIIGKILLYILIPSSNGFSPRRNN